MSIYTTDFSEDLVDTFPSGWTALWPINADTFVRAGDSENFGGQFLQIETGESGRYSLTNDDVDLDPLRSECEIFARCTSDVFSNVSDSGLGLVLRASGTIDLENAYVFDFFEDGDMRVFRLVNNSFTLLQQIPTSSLGLPADITSLGGVYLRLRFRISLTNITAKVWQESVEEPDWQFDVTDTLILTGGAGCWSGDPVPVLNYDFISIATGGDTAEIPSTQSSIPVFANHYRRQRA